MKEFRARARKAGINSGAFDGLRRQAGLDARSLSGRSRKTFLTDETVSKETVKRVSEVFAQYNAFLHQLAGNYVRRGIPFEYIRDYLFDGSIQSAGRYNPSKGTRFATWVTNGWKQKIFSAARDFIKARRRLKSDAWFRTLKTGEDPPLERLSRAEEIRRMHEAVATLDERERMILGHRYGFIPPAKTLKEIGIATGLTRERVRQLEARAIGKLRHSLRVVPVLEKSPAVPKAKTTLPKAKKTSQKR